ncbi:hypothetical protein MMC34_005950 [Xylographa carneopallida]|nr:hypothetical protein [Xylographa carneopallida]
MDFPFLSDANNSSGEGLYDADLREPLRKSDLLPLAELAWSPNVLSLISEEAVLRDKQAPYVKTTNTEPRSNRAILNLENNGIQRLDFKDYLPLGSLNFISAVAVQHLPEGWRETVGLPDALPDSHPLYTPLACLLKISLVRIFYRKNQTSDSLATIRVYVLPDDRALGTLPKTHRKHRHDLRTVMDLVDVTEDAWYGKVGPTAVLQGYRPKLTDDDSLFYIFNTLKSPCPNPSIVMDSATRDVMDGLLEGAPLIPGLKTRLYPYQERSAAMMVQREVNPIRMLDPRLETLTNPAGTSFYYDRDACTLLSERREYEEATGGILAETMGYGKTLICLAVILQTKGQWPRMPPQYSLGLQPTRPRVASLLQMTAATIGRNSIPWKPYFEQLSREGDDFQSCVRCLMDNAGCYIIPSSVKKHARKLQTHLPGNTIHLSSATLVIVPANLVHQWLREYHIHFEKKSLSLLLIDNLHKPIPAASELRNYDVILISKARFERESSSHDATMKAMKKQVSCRCRSRSCQCSSYPLQYHSPLKDLHFLRLIVDEGHAFASTGASTNAGKVLNDLHVERKWIISGTPTSGLMGVEVDMAAMEMLESASSTHAEANQEALAARRKEIAITQERKDIEKLGNLVVNFLQLKPWANSKQDDSASWYKYVMTSRTGTRNITSLKGTLESLVVRHRVEDVEKDRPLPPLFNKVVHLEPSYFDKLSINIFILVLAANAITSERVDRDYMFHRSNRKPLDELVRNLRQSGFYWTGFSAHQVSETVRVSTEFMQNEDNVLSGEDRALLQQALNIGSICLMSAAWKSFGEQAEMGIYVKDFPEPASEHWSLCPSKDRHLIYGTTQLQLAQKYIAEHAYASNPAAGLSEAGIEDKKKTQNVISKATKSEENSPSRPRIHTGSISGQVVPSSTISAPHGVHKKNVRVRTTLCPKEGTDSPTTSVSQQSIGRKSVMKSTSMFPSSSPTVLHPNSQLAKTLLIGTASAKLSYLLDRIALLHKDEKIIVFYEGDHIAWYIAQALELIHVQHLIYAKGLAVSLRASYLEWFNNTETYRVLLMDLPQAAHGLNVARASRIFFVNPVWSPSIEAQAIKRAHRIGQIRPVYVETLVLKNTFEEKLLNRRRVMTTDEHQQAAKSILDDTPMNNIIKNLNFIPLCPLEIQDDEAQMAKLHIPQALFGGSTNALSEDVPTASKGHDSCNTEDVEPQKRKRKAMFALDPQDSSETAEMTTKRR